MNPDSVFANQTELYEFLSKFLTNIKKDGVDRKTIEIYNRKSETVEAHWQDYLKNHSKMCEFADFDHVYFTKNCFDTAQEVYVTIRNIIDKTLEQLEQKKLLGVSPRIPQAGTPRSQASPSCRQETTSKVEELPSVADVVCKNTGLNELVRKQNINFKAFMRTVSNINVESFENKWQFENALKSLDSRWGEIDKLHWEIEGEGGSEEISYQRAFCNYEKTYNKFTNDINMKMWSVKHREKSTPQMNIPVFNGAYSNWVSFKDLFSEAIDKNPSVSNAQKMQFLKSKVVGEAERLIHHLQISSGNYQVCWDILNHRYGNKKMIFTSHINILLGLPNMQQQSVVMIKRLHDITKESLHAIQNLGVDTETWDPLLVHLLAQKLDNESFLEYIESIKNPRELPSLQEFLEYLEVKFTALEASRRKQEPTNQKTTSLQPIKTNNHNHNHKKFFQKNNHNAFCKEGTNFSMNTCHVSRSIICAVCNAEHGLWRCPDFIKMPHDQKLNKIEQLNYCKNCLISHFKKPCLSNKRCRKCLGTHNTLLHDALTSQSPSTSFNNQNTNTLTSKRSPVRSAHASWNDLTEILLATAIIYVKGLDGTLHRMRALIDQGSQLSLINENAAQTLGIKRSYFKGQIFGVGEKESSSKGMLQITIQSMHSDFSFDTSVIIMNNVVKRLPNNTFNKPLSWAHIQGINLADPEFYISRPVDLLLGADIYSKIMLGGILKGNKDEQPIAQQTQLGWLLCGSMRPHYHCNVVLNNTEDLLKFWEHEDINQKIEMSQEDHECLEYFYKTTNRLENGAYEVRLPFKPELKNKLGASKPQALAQYRNLEKKFQKNIDLKTEYHKFMEEYITLNHMKQTNTNHAADYYLPHHAVIRSESTTTKVRVVFNASAKSSGGYSLNDLLYRGPNIQKDIQELILKWRQYRFAYTSDIEKMYRMIYVHPDDQMYQKIIWRRPNQNIETYQLVTLTYGTKPAGFLAMMCLKQLACDEGHKYPEAAKQLEESFYMDDHCGGAHHIKSAKKLKSDLINLLKLGGFNLRKWTTNEPQILDDLETQQCTLTTYEFKQGDSTKTLGLGWNPKKDKFIFKMNINDEPNKIHTKRSLLSEISKLFDPLGWLTPISTTMKILFQNVWLTKLTWDEQLPEHINTEWTKLKQEFHEINNIEMDRWLGMTEKQNIELHGFCDASSKAYACVIYCKIVNKNHTTITMIAGKAKLAPLNKIVSTPRLELMGAHLLSQLIDKVQSSLSDYQKDIYCWTDSTAVLGWIKGDPARWQPFVANRVKNITKIVPSEHWRYVNTAENPADCASRGLTIRQLKNHELWWKGPTWLNKYSITLENQNRIFETNLETKSVYKTNTITSKREKDTVVNDIVNKLLIKFSCFAKINRVFAWILRLTISKQQVRRTYLDLGELRRAKLLIIKSVQTMEFADDISYINKHNKVHCKSKILNLNPFIDDLGILRVGGRLEHADICQNMKHPIILPHNHLLTNLLIDQAHQFTLHGGVRLTLANLRKQFWIIGGYMACKKFIRKCVTCKRHSPLKQYQLMGDLPEPRVNPEHAFYHCGVDYTGFVEVKANKGRGIRTTKGYISVFVCMVTKAVHLELVSDLSTVAFLAALNRMAARRGAPRHIYSDNGTNFVGANRILQEEHDQLLKVFNDSFQREITEMGINWHFNAPSWPNAGGLWERAVRSLKHHLKRVIGTQKLTFEEYTTLLTKIEACINSRPLCALTEDPDDLNFLTPAHFLSGRPGVTIIETAQDARTRWHLTTKLFQDLWSRWKSEYLVQLSSRPKWMDKQKCVDVGDLVVIHDDNLPAGKWALGRVIQTHPGSDGLTRTVSLKTANGTIVRPIVKTSVLPVNQGNIDKPITNKPAARPCERKPKVKLSTIATVLLTFTTIISPSHGLYSIKPLPDNQTLYFDPISKMQLIRDKWTIIMYYDMGPYWTGINTYNKMFNYLETLCTNIKIESHCNTIVQQARHDYQELEYYNELLLTQHFNVYDRQESQTRRRRRGLLNGVGYLANDLFGVLDSRFADQYVKDIETIQRNENHLSNLWKNQTSVIEAEFNLMKRMETTVTQQHKLINRKITELKDNYSTVQREIQNISYVNDFTLTAITSSNLLQSLRRLQNTFLDTITDIYHGRLSIHLLPPAQLKHELQTIYSKMPSDLTLPIDNLESDLLYIYKLLKVKARATRKYVIIEVSFPLITRERFQLYKLIPVPHQTRNVMTSIVPASDYVAVNLQKDSYFTTTINELNTCFRRESTYMCQLLNPIKDLKSDKNFCELQPETKECKVEKTSCSNKWVELHMTPQRFYFCCDSYTIKIICGDQMTVRQLSRAGVIGITQECTIKGKDIALYSIRQQSSSINITSSIYIPEFDQINHIVNVKIPDDNQIDGNFTIEMTNLGRAVEQLKNSNTEVETISSHDIHHYVISYTLAIIVLCVVAVWVWRTGRCCPTRRRETANGTRQHQFETNLPEPTTRRQHGHREQGVVEMQPLPRRQISAPVYSEVTEPCGNSASVSSEAIKQNVHQSDISARLHNLAKRWPSAKYGVIRPDKKSVINQNNERSVEEDSIV